MRPPYQKGDDITRGLACYICADFPPTTSWSKLMEHVRRQHGVTHQQLNGTHLHTMARGELTEQQRARRELAKKKAATADEGDKESCDEETHGPTLEQHVQAAPSHGASSSAQPFMWKKMTCWVKCGADGEPVNPMEITLCGPTQGAQTFDEEVSEDSATERKRKKKHRRAVKEQPPSMAISEKAKGWNPHGRIGGATRNWKSWPLATRGDIDLSDFSQYLEFTVGLIDSSVAIYVKRLQHFFGLMDLPDEFSHIGCMVGLYKSGLFGRLLALPILSPKLPSTRNLITVIEHFCDHLLLVCGRKNLKDASRCISQLKGEYIQRVKKRAHKDSFVGVLKKQARDAIRLRNLPPIDTIKAAVKESMIDLYHIWVAVNGTGGQATCQHSFATNVCMIGMWYMNSYAGRPGELEALLRSIVVDFLAQGDTALTMEKHKTDYKFGALGRFVPPGNAEAMRKVIDIHSPDSEFFLAPTSKSGHRVSAAQLLRKWGEVYTPEHQHPLPTLSRKYFATETVDDQNKEKALQLLCDMDGHSKNTARKSYVIPNLDADSRASESVFRNSDGDPMTWPSPEELAAGKVRSHARIQESFFRQAKRIRGRDRRGARGLQEDTHAEQRAPRVDAAEDGDTKRKLEQEKNKEVTETEDTDRKLNQKGNMEQMDSKSGNASEEPEEKKQKVERVDEASGADAAQSKEVVRSNRGRKGPFTDVQKDWIYKQCITFFGIDAAEGQCPPNSVLRSQLEQGVAHGDLPDTTTLEQIRHTSRVWRPSAK